MMMDEWDQQVASRDARGYPLARVILRAPRLVRSVYGLWRWQGTKSDALQRVLIDPIGAWKIEDGIVGFLISIAGADGKTRRRSCVLIDLELGEIVSIRAWYGASRRGAIGIGPREVDAFPEIPDGRRAALINAVIMLVERLKRRERGR